MRLTGKFTNDPKKFNMKEPGCCRTYAACFECGAIHYDSPCLCIGVTKCLNCYSEKSWLDFQEKVGGLIPIDDSQVFFSGLNWGHNNLTYYERQ